MRRTSLTIGASALVLLGCAGQQVYFPGERNNPANIDFASWRNKALAVTTGRQANLHAMTPGNIFVLGATGGVSEGGAVPAGAKIAAENGIEDPAVRLADDLLKAAQEHYGVREAAKVVVSLLANVTEIIVRTPAGTDLVLDVSVDSDFGPHLPFSRHYDVRMTVEALLIDIQSRKKIAASLCEPSSHSQPDPPTYDGLLADRARRLKALLDAQRNVCFEQFKREILNIHS